MKRWRILLADDHALLLDGFCNLLRPKYAVVGTVGDGDAVIKAAIRLKPDLIILDIAMPRLNGIDAAIATRRLLPHVKLLFVTMHTSPTYLRAALAAGANGYAVKSSGRDDILAAVESVLGGSRYITPCMGGDGCSAAILQKETALTKRLPTETLLTKKLESGDPAHAAVTLRLTVRERQILQLTAEGKTRKDVAYALGISGRTVAFHKGNLKRKLGLPSTAQLVRYALTEGLI